MKKIKEELYKYRGPIYIITYAAILFLILAYLDHIINFISTVNGILYPFFAGLIMAYVLNIPMVKIERCLDKYFEGTFIDKHSRGISIFFAVILVLIIILLLLMFVIPGFINSLVVLVNNIGYYFTSSINNIIRFLSRFDVDTTFLSNLSIDKVLKMFNLDYPKLMSEVSNWIIGQGSGAIMMFISIGSNLFNLFMGFMMSLYMLGSKEKLLSQCKTLTRAVFNTNVAKEIERIFKISNEIFNDFLGGKLIEVFLVGILMYLLMTIFKVPYASLIAVLCAALTIIPVFGALIATVIAVILLLSIDPIKALVFFIIYQVVQNLDGNFLYPKIIGKSLGLPALWILLSIILFGGLFGPLGMLLAVPLTACIYTFIGEFVRYRLKNKE